MIKIYLGNLGSGKSASAVREIIKDDSGRRTYTNLLIPSAKHVTHIRPEMVIKKVPTEKGNKFELNKEFWEAQKKPLNLLWDEIHLTANARSSMSKVNMVLSRFIAMGRRITGFDKRGYGHLVFIAQSERTIDVNIRELTNEIRYHIGHWNIICNDCSAGINANSEMEQIERCVVCGSWEIERKNFQTEVYRFNNWENYLKFRMGFKGRFHFDRYLLSDVSNYFKYYNTLQMEDIWESFIAEE